ncbi:hypothetical protein HD554DRAFT_1420427 [Boletus coccyginus]|nr:hypothetical protein HD554DRAFT_1420427 [Boletus coccyginus]
MNLNVLVVHLFFFVSLLPSLSVFVSADTKDGSLLLLSSPMNRTCHRRAQPSEELAWGKIKHFNHVTYVRFLVSVWGGGATWLTEMRSITDHVLLPIHLRGHDMYVTVMALCDNKSPSKKLRASAQ